MLSLSNNVTIDTDKKKYLKKNCTTNYATVKNNIGINKHNVYYSAKTHVNNDRPKNPTKFYSIQTVSACFLHDTEGFSVTRRKSHVQITPLNTSEQESQILIISITRD